MLVIIFVKYVELDCKVPNPSSAPHDYWVTAVNLEDYLSWSKHPPLHWKKVREQQSVLLLVFAFKSRYDSCLPPVTITLSVIQEKLLPVTLGVWEDGCLGSPARPSSSSKQRGMGNQPRPALHFRKKSLLMSCLEPPDWLLSNRTRGKIGCRGTSMRSFSSSSLHRKSSLTSHRQSYVTEVRKIERGIGRESSINYCSIFTLLF